MAFEKFGILNLSARYLKNYELGVWNMVSW